MIRAIVTDIEGTTSDIRFVHNVLFPYARERLAGFVTAQQHAEPVKTILDNLRRETDAPAASTADLITTLFAFMDEDRKSTALKALQRSSGATAISTATLPAISTRTYCRRWSNGKRRVLICMYIPQARWLRRNCYLATAMKVILLICSRAISIPW